MTFSIFGVKQVLQIVAGTGITLSSTGPDGTGVVTLNAASQVAGVTGFRSLIGDTPRTGSVILTATDVTNALGFAPAQQGSGVLTIGSALYTGNVTNSQIAAAATLGYGYTPASIVSPAFTGVPTIVTPPATSDNSDKIATTSYVVSKISAISAGVTLFNTRSGAVTLNSADVTTALGFTPATTVAPAFTGNPTLTNVLSTTDNSQKLATTAFVKSVVGASTVGTASVNGKTGTVLLDLGDIQTAFLRPAGGGAGDTTANGPYITFNETLPFVGTTGPIPPNGPAVHSGLTLVRNASYSGGSGQWTIDNSVATGMGKALQATTITGAATYNNEWTATFAMLSNANKDPSATPPFSWPQNLALYALGVQSGTAPVWATNFIVENRQAVPTTTIPGVQYANCSQTAASGAIVGIELGVNMTGVDYFASSVGIDVVTFETTGILGRVANPYCAIRVSGNNTPNAMFKNVQQWQYAFLALTGTNSSFYSSAVGTWGLNLEGTYTVPIDVSRANYPGGIAGTAFRTSQDTRIAFTNTDSMYIKYNSSLRTFQFWNDNILRASIDLTVGTAVNLSAGGSGGGVTSWNGRTGAVTAANISSDLPTLLGGTPVLSGSNPSLSGLSTTGTIYAGAVDITGGLAARGNLYLTASSTINWDSSGNWNSGMAMPTFRGMMRITIDGSQTAYVPVYYA